MLTLWQRLKEEPAIVGAMLSVLVALIAPRFGLSAEEVGYILAGVAALTGVGVRQSVTPVAKINRIRQGPHL